MPSAPPARSTVEQLLSDTFGEPVRVTSSERIGDWAVSRHRLDRSPASVPGSVPGSVIVKWLRDDPNGFRVDPAQVRTERAALEFVSTLDSTLAPRVLASDLAANVLVLEDLSPRIALDHLLRRYGAGEPACVEGRIAFARASGRLCAVTAGLAETYDAHRASYDLAGPVADLEHVLGPKWPDTVGLLTELDIEPRDAAARELSTVVESLREPGPFLTLTNGDPGSNNFLVDGTDGRLTDFEFAGYRHALTSATSFHVPGPMWLRVADPLAVELENTFRQQLVTAVPEADDDERFGVGMAAACFAATLERLNRLPVLANRAPGEPSRVQMVGTLEEAASTAERHRVFPRLTGWARAVAALLRKRWPDTDIDLTTLPSYAPR